MALLRSRGPFTTSTPLHFEGSTFSKLPINLLLNRFSEFDVSELGDLTDGCSSTGSHFNPFNKIHGAPTDSTRHVGDLGNIASDEYGVATFLFMDDVISLNGPASIIGYARFRLGS